MMCGKKKEMGLENDSNSICIVCMSSTAQSVAATPRPDCSNWHKCSQTHPELDQEEGVLRSFSKQLLQPTLLLREFVVDLTYIHCLQKRVVVWIIRLADVHKQMLVVLQKELRIRSMQHIHWQTFFIYIVYSFHWVQMLLSNVVCVSNEAFQNAFVKLFQVRSECLCDWTTVLRMRLVLRIATNAWLIAAVTPDQRDKHFIEMLPTW